MGRGLLMAVVLAGCGIEAGAQERIGGVDGASTSIAAGFAALHPDAARLLTGFHRGRERTFVALSTNRAAVAVTQRLLSTQSVELTADGIESVPVPAVAPQLEAVAEIFARGDAFRTELLQIYSADGSVEPRAAVDALVERYLADPATALASAPKSMTILGGHAFSGALQLEYPALNRTLWTYQWLELAVFEPLLAYREAAERGAGIDSTVVRFREMMAGSSGEHPMHMPMVPTIAPSLVDRHPEAAAILDNLYMLRLLVLDAMAAPGATDVARAEEIARLARRFQNPAESRISKLDWIAMSNRHGIWAQGGPAIGRLDGPERSAVDHSAHTSGRAMPPGGGM